MSQQNNLPVIGITTYGRNDKNQYYLTATYIESVRAAGGLPILLPPGERDFKSLFDLVDGLIFTGGGDIDPTYFGRTSNETVYGIDAERDEFELPFARLSMDETVPVLGICRGAQVMAVANGGSLVVDIPSEIDTSIKHSGKPVRPKHLVKIEEDSLLAKVVGKSAISVTSSHHQAARTIPEGWRYVAYAPDGVVEAFEYEAHPWMLAVQWHPEMDPDDPNHQHLFEGLVEAARKNKRAKQA